MALTSTVLQDAIIKVGADKTFSDFEGRMANYDAFRLFKDGAERLLPASQVKNLKNSARQPEKIAVLQRRATTLHTAYTCNFSPDGSNSAFVPVTYAITGFDAAITPANNADNYISEEDDLANQMMQGWRDVYAGLEGTSVAYLETNKSLTNLSPLLGTFAAGVVTVPDANKNRFYQSLPAIFQRNLLAGKIQDLANTEAIVDQLFIANQGTANEKNLAYQVANMDFYRSNYVTNASGMSETHYVTPLGAVGVYNWLPWEAKAKPTIGADNEGWDTMVDPIFGYEWLVHWKNMCTNGQYYKQFSFTASFGFMRQYSSDANASSILKYQFANPA